MSAATLSDAIPEYLASRKARGIKRATIANERVVLRQLLGVTGNILVRSVTGRHIDMYFSAYAHLSPGTWNRNTGYLSTFFKWCQARKYANREFDPLAGVRTRPVPPRNFIFLPSSRFGELLDAAANGRDRATLAIGLYTFQRASELTWMRWSDIDDGSANPKDWKVAVYRPKTETHDMLPLCLELRNEMHRWRLEYGAIVGETPRPDWFVVPAFKQGKWKQDARGRLVLAEPRGLNPTARNRTPQKAVHRALAAIGFTEEELVWEGAHTLRRSGGMALYEELAWERGHDGALRIVQSMYGHKNLATTERYLRLTLERKRRNDLLAGDTMFPDRQGEVVHIGTSNGRSAGV